jgi:hypothetical protein
MQFQQLEKTKRNFPAYKSGIWVFPVSTPGGNKSNTNNIVLLIDFDPTFENYENQEFIN